MLRFTGFFFALGLSFAKTVAAQVIGITPVPPFPTIGTQTVVSTVWAEPAPAMGYTWGWAIAVPGQSSSTFLTPGGTNMTLPVGFPGLYTVGCQVTYPPFCNIPTGIFMTTVGVSPPNALQQLQGQNTPVVPGGSLSLSWRIMSGLANVGPNMAGVLERRFTNIQMYTGEDIPDTAWANTQSTSWYMASGTMYEIYTPIYDPGSWAEIGTTQVIMTYDEELQIVFYYVTSSGAPFSYIAPLPTIHRVLTKISATTWTLTCTN